MNDPRISLRLIGDSRIYHCAQEISGEFFVDTSDPQELKAAELSVLWYTEGKGEEDIAVHHFQRIANDNGEVDFRRTQPFRTQLPNSPLSYDGEIVKVCWCVRLRVFLPQVQETVAETAFRLGNVSAASDAAPEEAEQQSEEM